MPGFKIGDTKATSGPSSLEEVARSHRWSVTVFGSDDFENLTDYAFSCTRPSIEFANIIIHNRQNEINLPGKHKHNPVVIKCYDMNGDSGQVNLIKLVRTWRDDVLDFDSQSLNFTGNIVSLKRNIAIKLLDGKGSPTNTYTLFGAWPSKIDPSELDYSNTGLATTAVTLLYDAFDES